MHSATSREPFLINKFMDALSKTIANTIRDVKTTTWDDIVETAERVMPTFGTADDEQQQLHINRIDANQTFKPLPQQQTNAQRHPQQKPPQQQQHFRGKRQRGRRRPYHSNQSGNAAIHTIEATDNNPQTTQSSTPTQQQSEESGNAQNCTVRADTSSKLPHVNGIIRFHNKDTNFNILVDCGSTHSFLRLEKLHQETQKLLRRFMQHPATFSNSLDLRLKFLNIKTISGVVRQACIIAPAIIRVNNWSSKLI